MFLQLRLPIPLAAYPAKWHTVFTDGSATSLSMEKRLRNLTTYFYITDCAESRSRTALKCVPLVPASPSCSKSPTRTPLSADRLQAVFTDSCRLHTNIINKYITYDLSIYFSKPCHPSRHAKPSSSSLSPTQSQPPRLTHVIVVIKIQKLRHPSIMRQILSPIHIQFKCSPLSWHPCLKRQPHIHSAHIAQPSHLMSHSPSTQPQSFIYKRLRFEPCHSHHAVRPYAQPHVNTRIHSPSRQQGKISHTHRVISHLRATYASTICSSFQSGWSSHIAA